MTTYFSDLMFFFVSNSRYALHNECFGQIPDKRGCAILYCFVILITIRQRSSNQHKMLIVKSSWRNFLYTMLAYFRTSNDTLWIRKKEFPLSLFKNKFYFLGLFHFTSILHKSWDFMEFFRKSCNGRKVVHIHIFFV